MSEITIGEILDDLRVAEEVLRKFERRYWITSEQFFKLYNNESTLKTKNLINSELFDCYKSIKNNNDILIKI